MTRSPGLQALLDDPGRADAVAGYHGALEHLVTGVYGVDHRQALQLLDRFLRDHERVLALGHLHTDAAELAGKNGALGVGETSLQLQRAGLRIHLVQGVFDVAGRRILRFVRQHQGQRQIPAGQRLRAAHPRQILRLGHLEADPDGVERHDGSERLGRIGIDQAAHRHQRIADTAIDGRANGAVLQIQFRGAERGALSLHLGLHGIDLGAGGERGLIDAGLQGGDVSLAGGERGGGGVQILFRTRRRPAPGA